LLQTAVRHSYLRSSVGLLQSFPVERMNAIFAELERQALDDVEAEGFRRDAARLRRQLDLRYLHQGYQLTVECESDTVREADKPRLKGAFDVLHRQLYGQAAEAEEAEIVTFRLQVEIEIDRFAQRALPRGDDDAASARRGERKLYDLARQTFVDAAVYDRAAFRAGAQLRGPAIVTQFDATTVVLEGQMLRVDPYGNLIIEETA
jgi:N-methylhydantoinase A